MKYTYSRSFHSREGHETFTAVECASFDEAQKYVDRGIYDRQLQLSQKYPPMPTGVPVGGMPTGTGIAVAGQSATAGPNPQSSSLNAPESAQTGDTVENAPADSEAPANVPSSALGN